MPKLVLTPITDNDHATTMNVNLTAIEVAIENTLSRDGTAPNSMNADFNLNSNFVLNMPAGTAPTHPLQKQQIEGLILASNPASLPIGATGQFLISDGAAYQAHTFVEADISDLQSYLLDITAESLADLSDVAQVTPTQFHALARNSGNTGWESRLLVEADISDLQAYSLSGHTHLLAAGATDVTATAAEVNLLDLAGLTAGWVLSADSATTASWKAGGGTNETPLDIIGDINMATPPVNAAYTGQLRFVDNDETDVVGYIGYDGSNPSDFYIRNLVTLADIVMEVDNLAGTPTEIFRGHMGNSAVPGQEAYCMMNRGIFNYVGSFGISNDDPPLMVTRAGDDGQTEPFLGLWYNNIQSFGASAATDNPITINGRGGNITLGNTTGGNTNGNLIVGHDKIWHLRTALDGLVTSWRSSTAPSTGGVPNDAFYKISSHAQTVAIEMGARAIDNSAVLTHEIHGAPWIIEGQNDVGNPRKIGVFETTQAISGVYVGEVNQQSSLWIWEESAPLASQAGWGQIWVRDDVPNTLMFTNDGGDSFELALGGGGTTSWSTGGGTSFATGSSSTYASGSVLEFDDNAPLEMGTGNDFSMTFNGTNLVLNSVIGSFDILLNDLDVDMNDGEIIEPILTNYAIQGESFTPTGTTQTLTYDNGQGSEIDLESVTGNITITLSGGPPSGTYGQMTVKMTQDSVTARTITWAGGTFNWAGGTAHVMNATLDGFSIYTFETWDGGTTWWGAGADYS